MLTQPIFILGLQRGGTNQILNVLRSHPDTFWPAGELHAVFRPASWRNEGAARLVRRLVRYAPLQLGARDPLNPHRPPPEGALAGWRGRWFDMVLARASRANAEEVRAYKAGMVEHGMAPADAPPPQRLAIKLMSYTVGLTPQLARLYPDATFLGFIRDPIAVCEGRVARGATIEAATALCTYFGGALEAADAAGTRFKVYRFEDLLASPEATIRDVLRFCRLDASRLRGICLQDKTRATDEDGRIVGLNKTEAYFALEDVHRHMRRDANTAAAARLSADQKREIVDRCHEVMTRYGYHDTSVSRGPEVDSSVRSR